ncbi:aspartate aminotransferase family protein [Desulfurococcus mucosus]|uniref:4-aminobutyrate aminotransferase apoenzyme n=1 Tax=Desulfurococcus mucosus (strain ATCC 35584 / DSM 2162 / JCM 9187 / O7/1) TaxID=765177 RepID=E8R8M5_DESM0|nr:aspartate aminotransferase family protein [Desulfurococcus mucosus]ADV64851.1 4-aminobutyrate aminotransferase apoenzyme [Desulfurococcus mucosus DSM 2162]
MVLDPGPIPRPFTLKYFPFKAVEGRGARVLDAEGREFIDFVSGAAVYNVGINREEVVNAVVDQARRLLNYTSLYFYMEEPVRLARKLVEVTPGRFDKRVVYGFTGSDAAEIALTSSMNYTGKPWLLSFTGSFHGTLYLSLSASGIFAGRGRGAAVYRRVLYAEYPNPYRNKWGVDGYEKPGELTALALSEVEEKIREAKGDVAAVIFEPVEGDAGVVVPPAGFLKGLREVADRHGVVLIGDEVQTGIGRTGSMWAVEHFSVEPDLLLAGKALGGGMPISAVIGRAEILESQPLLGLGFTNMGHAVCARAALATIEVVEKEHLAERARVLGEHASKRLREIAERVEAVGDVRGLGLMIGVEVVRDKASRRPDRATALKTCWRAWEKGLLVTTLGSHGNVLRIMPPLTISMEELDKGIDVLEESLRDAVEGRVPDEVLGFMQGW